MSDKQTMGAADIYRLECDTAEEVEAFRKIDERAPPSPETEKAPGEPEA